MIFLYRNQDAGVCFEMSRDWKRVFNEHALADPSWQLSYKHGTQCIDLDNSKFMYILQVVYYKAICRHFCTMSNILVIDPRLAGDVNLYIHCMQVPDCEHPTF